MAAAHECRVVVDVPADQESAHQRLLIACYEERGSLPDNAVRLDRIPRWDTIATKQAHGADEPVERVFDGARYATGVARADYSINRLRSATCG